ncbi:MAG: dimethylargininase [Mycobacteriaceae bacterium]
MTLSVPRFDPARGALELPVRLASPRHYLMCSPEHFDVTYVINPWMDPSQDVDVARATQQWEALRELYASLGHRVEVIAGVPGLPDMVFAANSATVVDGVAYGARFRTTQRAPEAALYARWFAERGVAVLVPTAVNEAEGDFAWTGRVLLAGTGFRTEAGAHAEAQEVLGVPVVSLTLTDPRYYHLDTALVVLDADTVAYYPLAFSPGSRKVLARLFPDAVLADAADAGCLGLNAVSDGRNVVLAQEATRLAGLLAERGFAPHLVDVSELRKAGGGPKCVTMELRGLQHTLRAARG